MKVRHPENVLEETGIPGGEEGPDILQGASLPRPGEADTPALEWQPFKAIVFRAQRHGSPGGNEGHEDRDQRHLVESVLVERLQPAEIVHPVRAEAGFFAQLPESRVQRRFAGFDVPVHRLPRAAAALADTPAQDQDLDPRAGGTEHIEINQGHSDGSHGRHATKAESSSMPFRWDFSG